MWKVVIVQLNEKFWWIFSSKFRSLWKDKKYLEIYQHTSGWIFFQNMLTRANLDLDKVQSSILMFQETGQNDRSVRICHDDHEDRICETFQWWASMKARWSIVCSYWLLLNNTVNLSNHSGAAILKMRTKCVCCKMWERSIRWMHHKVAFKYRLGTKRLQFL